MYHPEGVYPAMPTPFRRNGDLDTGLLRELVTYFDGTDANGLLVMGTAGEFAMMSDAERRMVVDVAMSSAGKLEMIFNVGWASTRETIALAKYAKDAGATAVIAVEPYFFHPTQEGIARHYLDIAEATDFPVIAYNIPSFAGNRLTPDIMDDFAADDRVVGLKDSGGDAAALSDFIFRAPDGFSVLVGMDSLVSAGMALGAKGMAVGSAAIAPELCAEMYRAMKNGNHCRAFELQRSLDHAIRAMQIGTFPASIKYAMSYFGHPAGYVRAPLQELDEAQRREVEMHLMNIRIMKEQLL
ncbi:MAG: dihydrodipicolinate synthase family protein [Methanocella sp.]